MNSGCIISMGSINVDLQARADSWPQPGHLSMLRDFIVVGGGKAANVAYLARRLGVPAMLVARTGDDALAPHSSRSASTCILPARSRVRIPGQR
jgi:ribokinase